MATRPTAASGTYQQSGPSAPQAARAVLAEVPNQLKGFGDVPAYLNTTFADPKANLLFQAKAAGSGGEAITVAIVVAGNNTPFSIGVVGNAITINAATDATGNSISLARNVRDAVNANGPASALVTSALAYGSNGASPVGALAATNLAGDRTVSTGQAGDQPLPAQHPAENIYATA